jgi:hypothetical protein
MAQCEGGSGEGPEYGNYGEQRQPDREEMRRPAETYLHREILPEELHYHSRSEPPSPEENARRRKEGRKGVFRSNPSLLIILIDIGVVVLVILFLLPFLQPKGSVEDFHGYSFALHGYAHSAQATVSVVIQPAGAVPSADSDGAKAGFVLQMRILKADSGEAVLKFAPKDLSDEPLVLRHEFAIPPEMRDNKVVVRCDIFHGSDSVVLEKKLVQ